MSAQGPRHGRRSLEVLGKGMMPEILPEPVLAKGSAASPRERVRARLRQIMERTIAVGTTASLSVACNTKAHGDHPGTGGVTGGGGRGGSAGYGVVDPLPDPYTGGTSTPGGTGGYAVVDPLPPPYVCPDPEWPSLDVRRVEWQENSILLDVQPESLNGLLHTTLQTVTASPGVTATIESPAGVVRIVRASDVWPEVVELYLGFECDGESGLVNYQVGLRLFTSPPATMGSVPYELIDEGADAGLD